VIRFLTMFDLPEWLAPHTISLNGGCIMKSCGIAFGSDRLVFRLRIASAEDMVIKYEQKIFPNR
jgi:hypothetical protein